MPGTDPTAIANFVRTWNAADALDSAGYTLGATTAPVAFQRITSLVARAPSTALTLTPGATGCQITQMGGVGMTFDPTYNVTTPNMQNVAASLSRTTYTYIVVVRAPMAFGDVATPSDTSLQKTWLGGTGGRMLVNVDTGTNTAAGLADTNRQVLSFSRSGGGASTNALGGFNMPASRQIYIFRGNGTSHWASTYRNGAIVNGATAAVQATAAASTFAFGLNSGDFGFRGILDEAFQFDAALSDADVLAACQYLADAYAAAGTPIKHSPGTRLAIIGDSIAGGFHSDRCENWVNMLDAALGADILLDQQSVSGADVDCFANTSFFDETVGNSRNELGFTFGRRIAIVALGANWLRQVTGSRISAATWIATYATVVSKLRTAGFSKVYGVVPIGIGNASDPNAQETRRREYRTAMRAASFLDGVIDTLGTVFHPSAETALAVGRCVGGSAYQLASTTTGLPLDGTNNTTGVAIGIDGIHIGVVGQPLYYAMVRAQQALARDIGLQSGGGARRLRMGTR